MWEPEVIIIVVAVIVAGLLAVFFKTVRVVLLGAAAFAVVLCIAFAAQDALAEEATVIAAFYEDDIAIVLTSDGNEQKFDRDDLIPGDKLDIVEDDYKYLGGDYSSWYTVEVNSITFADFLYEEDAIAYADSFANADVYYVKKVR